eukprot:IDg18341t1
MLRLRCWDLSGVEFSHSEYVTDIRISGQPLVATLGSVFGRLCEDLSVIGGVAAALPSAHFATRGDAAAVGAFLVAA